ncbi:MAG: acyl-CoA mutase large subunit family protein [Prolixibacteraceae bacterium]|nr:acyl-CoA mutase large subunit family protein [Prolixibacteraceae bacterium]
MTVNNRKTLFDEFPPVSGADWQQQIEADLKGRDFEKVLVWKTNEGFNVRPYYRAEDLENIQFINSLPGQFPYVRGNKTNGNTWLIRQDIQVNTPEEANKKVLDVLNKGVNSLGLVFKGCAQVTVADLEIVLKDICLDAIEVNLISCCKSVSNAKALAAYITKTYGANSNVVASVKVDPLGSLTRNGGFDEAVYAEMKALIEETNSLENFRSITVTGKNFRDAGSSIVQELGFSLAMGAEYLSALTEAGLSVDDVACNIKFNFGVGANYFMEIAKLRAARLLWAKVVETYGPKCECSAKMRIHSENTIFNKTIYDPYVNMLRTQTEAMSAVLGGTDSLTVLPFNAVYEESTPFSERIARNQQILLKEEAHLDKIADPAAGSYYIETLTDSIAEQAWKLFLDVQEKGGYVAAFKQGFVQAQVNATAAKMDSAIATRRENLLGTNQFPNFTEYLQKEMDAEIFSKQIRKSDNAVAEPLARYRGAQAFEALRYATDVYSKDNKRPLAFMLTVGNLNMRKARAQFACNFFAVAGFDVQEGKGYSTVEDGVADAVELGADIVVLCSSDDEYAELAPAAAEMLIDEIFVVAGSPACKEELEAKGIKNFIHVRSNLLEELKGYQAQLIK